MVGIIAFVKSLRRWEESMIESSRIMEEVSLESRMKQLRSGYCGDVEDDEVAYLKHI